MWRIIRVLNPFLPNCYLINSDGRILGAQAIGEAGVDRRIDIIAMAIQMKATVFDLEESELCYAPQFGAAKDAVNVVGMIAANEMRGDLHITHWDAMGANNAIVLDVREADEIAANALPGTETLHIPLDKLRERQDELPKDREIHVSCAVGARAYNAVRLLHNLGYRASLLSGGEKTFAHLQPYQAANDQCFSSNGTAKMTSDDTLLQLDDADFNQLIAQASIEEIEAGTAQQLMAESYQFLDVRYAEEYDDGHIPNVQLIPLPELRNRLQELAPEQKYITCCHSGKRSAIAAMLLQQNGFQAMSLKNGMRDWPYELVSGYQ